jgi:signal transduction histidine kinase
MAEQPTPGASPFREADEVFDLVSHEIRAPLTVISGYLEILERPLDENSHARALAESRRAVERIERLLEDLESATCAADCFAPRELATVSMSALAAESVTAHQDTSTCRSEVHVRSACPGDVLGDDVRLRQVLGNLIGNAIAYTPEGTRITVAVRCEGDTVITTVEDEGPGIPEDQLERVFRRFERLGTEDPSRPGTGLGLYIVRAIIEAHGGSVRAEAGSEGRGARFVIELPAAPMT